MPHCGVLFAVSYSEILQATWDCTEMSYSTLPHLKDAHKKNEQNIQSGLRNNRLKLEPTCWPTLHSFIFNVSVGYLYHHVACISPVRWSKSKTLEDTLCFIFQRVKTFVVKASKRGRVLNSDFSNLRLYILMILCVCISQACIPVYYSRPIMFPSGFLFRFTHPY